VHCTESLAVVVASRGPACTDHRPHTERVARRDLLTAFAGLAGVALCAGCSTGSGPVAPVAPPAPAGPAVADLPPSSAVAATDWDRYRLRAALRLMEANPGRVYTAPAPDPLLAIPVLEIELNGDGSVRHIRVQREPRQAKDTIQLAIDAVHRAAPFGSVAHLPRPWRFTEVFLFDDDRRFKPRVLD